MLWCTSSWLLSVVLLSNYVTNLPKIYITLSIVCLKDLIYVAIIFVLIFCWCIVHVMSSNMPYKSDLDVAQMCFLQMLCQLCQLSIFNIIPSSNPQTIDDFKRHAHHQFITRMKCVCIIFEHFQMPCLNGGIALFILIHRALNRKQPFIWLCLNNLNMSHCHLLDVSPLILMWCCHHYFFSYHIIRSTHIEIIVNIDSVSSSSKLLSKAWHCR